MKTKIKKNTFAHSLSVLLLSSLLTSFGVSGQVKNNPNQCETLIQSLKEGETTLSDLLILSSPCAKPEFLEKALFDKLNGLKKKMLLGVAVNKLVDKLADSGAVPGLNENTKKMAQIMLLAAIHSELYDRGYDNPAYKFLGWDKITSDQTIRLNTLASKHGLSVNVPFIEPKFKNALRELTGGTYNSLSTFSILSDNTDALQKRIDLIRKATKSIKLLTWGFHDDSSGDVLVNELIAIKQKNKALDIKILVDGQVGERPGYSENLKDLSKAGIQVSYWKSKLNSFFGMHSKMLIVDDKESIEGGRNIGDYYLQGEQWLDLDVQLTGDVAQTKNPNLFTRLWNEASKQKMIPIPESSSGGTGDILTFLSEPQHLMTDKILDLTVLAIKNAKTSIDIMNAYVILTPGLRSALKEAVARGVEVRVFSNSALSVDEPIVSIPIQRSLAELKAMGARVFVKKGKTLHTKYFRADSLVWLGSYNLHPRSARYEIEKAMVSLNPHFNKALVDNFNSILRDSSLAQEVSSALELKTPQNPGMDFIFNNVIFNQL